MNCKGCGSEWFLEERQVLLREEPAAPFSPALVSRVRYAYRCAECSLAYGQNPKASLQRRKKAS